MCKQSKPSYHARSVGTGRPALTRLATQGKGRPNTNESTDDLGLVSIGVGHCDHHERDFQCPSCRRETMPTKPKQTTRMIKAQCTACGFTFRASRRWILDGQGKTKELACPDVECGAQMRVDGEELEAAEQGASGQGGGTPTEDEFDPGTPDDESDGELTTYAGSDAVSSTHGEPMAGLGNVEPVQ